MKRYRTSSHQTEIESLEVVRETEKFVMYAVKGWRGGEVQERREAKVSDFHRWHESWEAAHAHLLARAEQRLASLHRALLDAQNKLETLQGMKKPADA